MVISPSEMVNSLMNFLKLFNHQNFIPKTVLDLGSGTGYITELLLKKFPKDDLTFWSNGKICPIPISLDQNDELHLDFIELTSILLCKCLNLELEFGLHPQFF
jgi:hypothetical protein